MTSRAAIVGDWGTTRLRLFRIAEEQVVARLTGPGIGQLTDTPPAALTASLREWAEEAGERGVLLCGMAGSRNGLLVVPYASCPVDLPAWAAGARRIAIEGIDVTIATGVAGRNFAGRPDVMRGEETQIFGAVARRPDLGRGRHLLVLPGTHSKWAELDDGRIERVQTFPTGELFALLRDHSTLTRAGSDDEGRDEGFAAGLERAALGTLGALFEARAGQLVAGRTHGWALGLLSGVLIGSEVREGLALLARSPRSVTVIGDAALGALYRSALAGAGCDTTALDGDQCAIAGLLSLHAILSGDRHDA